MSLLNEIVDQLVERFGPHETMQALVDNEKMQEEFRDNANVCWHFEHKWRTANSTWRQAWAVLIMPSVTIYGENDRQRPVG